MGPTAVSMKKRSIRQGRVAPLEVPSLPMLSNSECLSLQARGRAGRCLCLQQDLTRRRLPRPSAPLRVHDPRCCCCSSSCCHGRRTGGVRGGTRCGGRCLGMVAETGAAATHHRPASHRAPPPRPPHSTTTTTLPSPPPHTHHHTHKLPLALNHN